MVSLRTIETRLAKFSRVALPVFAVLETGASWSMFGGAAALIHPMYLHSVAGMVLLFVEARHSLRARPVRAPGLMCAGLAWWAATGWQWNP